MWNCSWLSGASDLIRSLVRMLADGGSHRRAAARQQERRREAATRAAVTRATRHEKQVQQIADRIRQGQGIEQRERCYCCNKLLQDRTSIERGIGPECWQDILARIERVAVQARSEEVNA